MFLPISLDFRFAISDRHAAAQSCQLLVLMRMIDSLSLAYLTPLYQANELMPCPVTQVVEWCDLKQSSAERRTRLQDGKEST